VSQPEYEAHDINSDLIYCRNCGKRVHKKAIACPSCGVPPRLEKHFCSNCGVATNTNQILCVSCGATLSSTIGSNEKNKLATVLLAIIFGCIGLHKFYLGYVKEGMIMLILSIVAGAITEGVFVLIMAVIGLIEGIIYLAKPDDEFNRIYVIGKRGWF